MVLCDGQALRAATVRDRDRLVPVGAVGLDALGGNLRAQLCFGIVCPFIPAEVVGQEPQ